MTRPGGIRSTSVSTASTYSSGVMARHDMGSGTGRASEGAQNGRVREAVTGAKRIVVKVGSSSLTTAAGGIDGERVSSLVDALAKLIDDGREVVLVSSGAIAAGLAPLGLRRRPRDLA